MNCTHLREILEYQKECLRKKIDGSKFKGSVGERNLAVSNFIDSNAEATRKRYCQMCKDNDCCELYIRRYGR